MLFIYAGIFGHLVGSDEESSGRPSSDDEKRPKKKGSGRHSSSSSSSSDSSSLSKGGEAASAKPSKKEKKEKKDEAESGSIAKKKSKRQERLDKIKIVVVPLDELSSDIASCPRQFMIAKASFEAAISGKLSGWEKETLEGDMQSKADEFLADAEPVKDNPEVQSLNITGIASAATAAAQALKSFSDALCSWKLPVDIDDKRRSFESLCKAYDKGLQDIETYADTIAGFTLRQKFKMKARDQQQKDALKSVKDTYFTSFTKCGVPRIVSKVE